MGFVIIPACFTVSFTKSLADKGIRVSAVAPGSVWTPLIVTTMPPEKATSFGGDVPLARPAQPAELAPTFVYLASAGASYVTGEVFGNTGRKSPF
ncbi:MAG TPA: SDR family oxidoreductase [Gemmata sp.]